MRIIVFGGTGWVGHNIVLELVAAGHEVTACSRGAKTEFTGALPSDIGHIKADKSNDSDMERVFRNQWDVVVDSVPTGQSIDLVVKHAKGLKHYLHCSSTAGYAPLPCVPGDETMPYTAFRGGWKEKAVVDAKVVELWKSERFPVTVLRPSYITGPGMVPLDNLGGRRTDFLPDILAGRVIDLPNDGQALLQPVHVRDLARAFRLAVTQPDSKGRIYNICLEKAVTLTRYIEITARALNREPSIEYASIPVLLEKYGDAIHARGLHFLAMHMCFDISKARSELGYVPHCSTREAIEETARWGSVRFP